MDLKELHEKYYNAKAFRDTYFTKESSFFENTIAEMFSHVIKLLSSGDLKGKTVIALSFGPFPFYTFPISDYFNEITFACADNNSTQEIQKWLKNEPDALDWGHIIKMICELQGCGKKWIEKQDMFKKKFKEVLKHDVISCNPLSPVIHRQADCLVLAHCLEHFVTDEKSYCEALKNVSLLLKTGGHLIMTAVLETTFYMCGDFKFPLFCLEEDFLKDAIKGAGYVIEGLHIYKRHSEKLNYITDYKYFAVLKARKEREM